MFTPHHAYQNERIKILFSVCVRGKPVNVSPLTLPPEYLRWVIRVISKKTKRSFGYFALTILCVYIIWGGGEERPEGNKRLFLFLPFFFLDFYLIFRQRYRGCSLFYLLRVSSSSLHKIPWELRLNSEVTINRIRLSGFFSMKITRRTWLNVWICVALWIGWFRHLFMKCICHVFFLLTWVKKQVKFE